MMTESGRFLAKLLSVALQYPDSELQTSLAELNELPEVLPDNSSEQILRGFLNYLENTPLLRAQECYSQTFDLSPDSCLYLTWHRWGENKERGADLARLVRIYRDGGFQCVTGDLPDYLPMVLEFASVCPDESGFKLLGEFGPEIDKIRQRLNESGSPYAGLLTLLSEKSFSPQPETAEERE
ncbi:MAG: nitrate reductase molybdenum cofactor assembly chaperone [Syntrophobacteraceae bacterium]